MLYYLNCADWIHGGLRYLKLNEKKLRLCDRSLCKFNLLADMRRNLGIPNQNPPVALSPSPIVGGFVQYS